MADRPEILSAKSVKAFRDALRSDAPAPDLQAAVGNLIAEMVDLPPDATIRVEGEIAFGAELYSYYRGTGYYRGYFVDREEYWNASTARSTKPSGLERLLRFLGVKAVPRPLQTLRPSPFDSDLRRLRAVPSLAYVFMFHGDGRVREQALNRLDDLVGSPFFFVAVVRRLNDWAEPVREAARLCAARLFPVTDATVIVEGATYLLRVAGDWERWDMRVAAELEATLEREDVGAALAERLSVEKNGKAALVLRKALRRPGLDPHLPLLACQAIQPIVRAIALQALLQQETRWPTRRRWNSGLECWERIFERRAVSCEVALEGLIKAGLRDRSPLVRKIAVDGMTRHRRALGALDALMRILKAERNMTVISRLDFLRRKLAEEQAGA